MMYPRYYSKILIVLFLISIIFNNKLFIILFILHYKRKVPWYSDKKMNKILIQKKSSDWMSHIKDNIDIRELAIPGTHDSAASEFIENPLILWYANFMCQVQSWSIEDQLTSGVRYFDLRPGGDGIIYHATHKTKYNFSKIFEIFSNFLTAHPGEGLFVRIQFQFIGCAKNNFDECKETQIYAVLQKYEKILYKEKNVPNIGQLRGKIFIFLERLEYKDYMLWDSNDLIELQDYYRLFGIRKFELDKKRKLVRNLMFSEDKKKLIINHCSAIGRGALTTLKYVAYSVNEVPYIEKDFRGIFAFDFPGEYLMNHVINQNNKFCS